MKKQGNIKAESIIVGVLANLVLKNLSFFGPAAASLIAVIFYRVSSKKKAGLSEGASIGLLAGSLTVILWFLLEFIRDPLSITLTVSSEGIEFHTLMDLWSYAFSLLTSSLFGVFGGIVGSVFSGKPDMKPREIPKKLWDNILYLSLVLLPLSGVRIFISGSSFPVGELFFMMAYPLYSLPCILFGFFTEKNSSAKAGTGFGLAFLTTAIIIAVEFASSDIPSPHTKIVPYTLYALSLGVISTWAGSVAGSLIRGKLKLTRLQLGFRKTLTLIYITYLLAALIMLIQYPDTVDIILFLKK